MVVEKQDPRVVKTQTSLRRALVYLMQHERLENISVQKITKTAHITRGTFYLHYKDKQSFFETALNEELNLLFDHVVHQDPQQLDKDHQPVMTLSINDLFTYLEHNSEVFTVLLSGQQNRYFYNRFYERLTVLMTEYAKQLGSDLEELDVPLRVQVSFLNSALLGLIVRWLRLGLIYTPRYMTQSLAKMLNQFTSHHLLVTSFFDFQVPRGVSVAAEIVKIN